MSTRDAVLLGVLFAALPTTADAQQARVTVSATIIAPHGVGSTENLEFDPVVRGEPAFVDAVSGSGGTPGHVEFRHNGGFRARLDGAPDVLRGAGSETLAVEWRCGVSSAVERAPAAAGVCGADDVVAAAGAAGTTVLWIGGRLLDTDVPPGVYSAQISVVFSGL